MATPRTPPGRNSFVIAWPWGESGAAHKSDFRHQTGDGGVFSVQRIAYRKKIAGCGGVAADGSKKNKMVFGNFLEDPTFAV